MARRSDGHLRFFVHTNRYLDSESCHHLNHKIATASTLFHHATNHCSIEHKRKEINTAKKSLEINGFADNLINNCYRNGVTQNNRNVSTNAENDRYISVPIIVKLSGQIQPY